MPPDSAGWNNIWETQRSRTPEGLCRPAPARPERIPAESGSPSGRVPCCQGLFLTQKQHVRDAVTHWVALHLRAVVWLFGVCCHLRTLTKWIPDSAHLTLTPTPSQPCHMDNSFFAKRKDMHTCCFHSNFVLQFPCVRKLLF